MDPLFLTHYLLSIQQSNRADCMNKMTVVVSAQRFVPHFDETDSPNMSGCVVNICGIVCSVVGEIYRVKFIHSASGSIILDPILLTHYY